MLLKKRLFAFLIDLLLVSMISMTLGNLSYLNPYKESYENATAQYTEVYDGYQNIIFDDSSDELPDINSAVSYLTDSIMPTLKKVEKYYVFYAFWYLVIYFLYFCVFTYFNNGQTLGKRLMHIRVVNKGSDELYLNRAFRRCLLNGSSLYFGVNIIVLLEMFCTLINDLSLFTYSYFGLQVVGMLIELSLVITLITSRGKRLTNDIVAGTEVIEVK